MENSLAGRGAEGAAAREKLVHDLRNAFDDAEELLRLTAEQAGEKVADARARMTASLARARDRVADINAAAMAQSRAAAEATDRYVHENPWQAIGVAALVAFVVGALVSRR